MTDTATRVVLSYPADIDDWDCDELTKPAFRRYLTRVHDTADVGDIWEEVVGSDCGTPSDVALRVERVEGGADLTDETEIEYESRDEQIVDA
ncbi:MAG: hypothetical protein ABEH35_07585 [Haloarculaceae archaeon]